MRKVYLQQQIYKVSGNSGITINIEITPDEIQLLTKRGDIEFIFRDCNDIETLERWQELIKLMDMAVGFAKQTLDKPRVTKLQLKKHGHKAKRGGE